MYKEQASITAKGITLIRALESARPPEERILFDPYAREFLPGWFYQLGVFITKIGYTELRAPGVMGFLAARERYIDEILQTSLDEGIEQLVILGAGYDGRAYRFDGLKSGVKVFEVDHPATQRDKLKRLVKIFGQIPEHVIYVSVDFNTQLLEEQLFKCGFDPGLKTLYIWQGVTYYLTSEAVDKTLRWIGQASGPGSKIVFDYIDSSVLEGRQKHSEVRGMRQYQGLTGEGLRFGIPDGSIQTFLESRGFRQVKNTGSDELHQLYFTGKRQERKVISGYGIASAVVRTENEPAGRQGKAE